MNIIPFQINGFAGGTDVTLYPTLLHFNGKNYLVDCGYEETFGAFVDQLKKIGVSIQDLHAVLISHDDIDHLGALQLFNEINPNLLVYSSAIEAASVAGKLKSERLLQAEASFDQLPDHYKDWALGFIESLKTIKRVPVDNVLHDNDCIDGELRVIATPGHTQGHISFYVPDQRTLIANDAVVIENDELNIANPNFTLDLKAAVQSVAKLVKLPIDRLICYHGGILEGNVQQYLSALLDKYATYA